MKRVWNLAATLARVGNRLLNIVIALVLIVALLIGGYGLWDTWKIYHNAALDPDLLIYKPVATGEDTPNPSLSELQKINPDVCAWLTVDDTNIDYPVVQGKTNMDYINQAVDKSFSLSGSIFLDSANANDFSDPYSLIFGHHMEGDVMFGEIPYFLESDYFNSHTSGVLFTVEHTYYIQWFACLQTNSHDLKIYNPTAYSNNSSISELLDYVKSIATQYRDVGVSATDQIVALSTCYDTTTNGRAVLVGRFS
jgi:sortase B